MNFGYKPMGFGEHLLQLIRMEEGGLARDKIREVWGFETPEGGEATRFQLALADAFYWMMRADIYEADYLLECLNERYGREEILEAIDLITAQIDQATDDPLGYAFEHPRPIRQTLMTIALIRHLSPGVAAKRAAEKYIGAIRQQLAQITFPDNLQRVFDLEELAGASKDNIPVFMDPMGWNLNDVETVDVPRVTNFDKACSEANEWVGRFVPEPDLRAHLLARYSVEQIIEASTAIERTARTAVNPLAFALLLPFPLRLTIVMLAIHRWYDSGGENVDVSSDLPPKPPSPGHWGGRTPGYEEPLPPRRRDLDIGRRDMRR